MTLGPGTRLGHYEVLAPLGAGGMGEVFRARDLKLGREVALKLLPESLANDAPALERFQREARAASAFRASPPSGRSRGRVACRRRRSGRRRLPPRP